MVVIDLNNNFLKAKKITSLKGPYIIGVYGMKKSSYSLSVTQEKNALTTIDAGMSLRRMQEPFDSAYFLYYHLPGNKDFKV